MNKPNGKHLSRRTGFNRREILRLGGVGLGGLALPELLRLEQLAMGRTPRTKAKSVIILFLSGGPAHQDMWDMKPDAPEEVRGTFKSIGTSVPGTRICEHLPRMASLADKYAIIRSVHHSTTSHPAACFWMMAGSRINRPASESGRLSRADRPHVGAALAKVLGQVGYMPSSVMVPEAIQPNGPVRSGQHAGFLGPAYDPYLVNSDPNSVEFTPGAVRLERGLSVDRLNGRITLLDQFNRRVQDLNQTMSHSEFEQYYKDAAQIISSPVAQRAFDVRSEPLAVRERYGRHVFGQSVLLARRLVEAGVRLVHVNWVRHDGGSGGQGYDSHSDHLNWAKTELLPPTDAAFASLITDLEVRGMLEETLVIMMGEFGRTPKFNPKGGRDHWPHCFSVVMAGGGIRGGAVYGKSDRLAAYPQQDAVTPNDLTATMYACMGVEPHTVIHDRQNRPYRLVDGQPLSTLL